MRHEAVGAPAGDGSMPAAVGPIVGVRVHPLTVAQLHAALAATIDGGRRARVLNVNVHALNLAQREPWLRAFLNEGEIVFCDGAGVQLGARLLGHAIPERITYADWLWQLAAFGAARGDRFFFLGARPGVAERAAANLRARFPGLQVVGTQHGYFDKAPGHAENEAVVAAINEKRPHVLLVSFGMPLQEQWLQENWARLQVNVALTGGAALDYAAGELRRGPAWMTDNGLEWLARLLIEPRRLWQRYLVGNPLFLWRVLRQRMAGG